jgi:hypothetical protein
MLQEETRADIQPAAGKNVGVVMDGPGVPSSFQL